MIKEDTTVKIMQGDDLHLEFSVCRHEENENVAIIYINSDHLESFVRNLGFAVALSFDKARAPGMDPEMTAPTKDVCTVWNMARLVNNAAVALLDMDDRTDEDGKRPDGVGLMLPVSIADDMVEFLNRLYTEAGATRHAMN